MYFYHYYIQKGFKIEYLRALGFWEKQMMVASLDVELSKENEKLEMQQKLLKENVTPVVAL